MWINIPKRSSRRRLSEKKQSRLRILLFAILQDLQTTRFYFKTEIHPAGLESSNVVEGTTWSQDFINHQNTHKLSNFFKKTIAFINYRMSKMAIFFSIVVFVSDDLINPLPLSLIWLILIITPMCCIKYMEWNSRIELAQERGPYALRWQQKSKW